jgi:hypothetical protein
MERPGAIVRWQDIEDPEAFIYDGDDEPMCLDANYSRHFRFARLGIHHIRVEPGHRTSFPHAERRPLHSDWWEDPPQRPLGGHDGRTDMREGKT